MGFAAPGFSYNENMTTLFRLEVSEIADGIVQIKGIAREPGYRSKIGKVYDCTAPDKEDLGRWISSQAGKRGKKITSAALNAGIAVAQGDVEDQFGAVRTGKKLMLHQRHPPG